MHTVILRLADLIVLNEEVLWGVDDDAPVEPGGQGLKEGLRGQLHQVVQDPLSLRHKTINQSIWMLELKPSVLA